jgi:hypothetical protein
MSARRHRMRQRANVLVLVLLLIVPIVLSGHHHGGSEATRPCAACAAVQHAPIARAPAPLTLAVSLACVFTVEKAAVARSLRDQAPPSGRAPPRRSLPPIA